jgi:hypothetical protein
MTRRSQVVFAALGGGNVSGKYEGAYEILACADVNTDSVNMPRVTVINYGTTGCTGSDGVVRKGKVVITYDGDYRDAGTNIVTTYSHFFENDNELTGTETMFNQGENGNGHITFTFTSDADFNLANNGGTYSENFTGTVEWMTGSATTTTDDDQYAYLLSGTCTEPNNDVYTWTTNVALLKNFAPSCSAFFVEGIAKCVKPDASEATVDFGDTTCDDLATITTNGIPTTVDLKN